MTEHNYVDCYYCKHWDLERRLHEVCERCNNTTKIIDPKEMLCNMCAGPMYSPEQLEYQTRGGLHDVSVEGNYESCHLLDGTRYTFSLCEECLRKMFVQFKIPPQIENEYDDEEGSFAKDQQWYEFRLWRDNGGHHQAYLDKRCNFHTKDCPNVAEYTVYHHGEFTEDCCCEEHKAAALAAGYVSYTLGPFVSNTLKAFL